MKPKILSEMTGSTHGIKFKMTPPIKPKKRKVIVPRTGADVVAEEIEGLTIRHAMRSFAFSRWAKTIKPCIDNKFLSADSIGMRKTISFGLRDWIVGWPTTVFP